MSAWMGLRRLIACASVVLVLGSLSRTFVATSFSFVLIGQVLLGIAACCVVNVQIQFCYNWFHPDKRPLFIALVSVMNILGGGMGNIIPFFFVGDTELPEEQLRAQFLFYTRFVLFFCGGLCAVVVLLFQTEPPEGFG